MSEATSGEDTRLPRPLVAAYGVGQAAEGIANYLLTALLLFYYTSVLGLSGTLAGLALMIGLVFDAVTDPLVAVVSDRTESRWGRRHPYLFASALPLAAGLALAFRPPEFVAGQPALFAWLLAMVIGIRAALTLFHVPHMALGAELTRDYDERTRVVTARSIAAVVGTALVITAYFMIVAAYESPDWEDPRLNPRPYAVHSALASVSAAILVLVSAFGTRSAIPRLSAPSSSLTGSLGGQALRDFREAAALPAFRVLLLGFTLCSIAWGFSSAIQAHLALYFWEVSIEMQGVGGIGLMIGFGFGMSTWQQVARRRDKKPAFVAGMAWYTAFAAIGPFLKVAGWLPAQGTTAYGLAYAALGGLTAFGAAAAAVLAGSMMGDITDEDELRSGHRREGVFFGALSFATKVANGVGAAVGGLVYDAVGLTRGVAPDAAPPGAGNQLGIASALLILAFVGFGVVCFRRYGLDRERHDAISRALADRARERTAQGAEEPEPLR